VGACFPLVTRLVLCDWLGSPCLCEHGPILINPSIHPSIPFRSIPSTETHPAFKAEAARAEEDRGKKVEKAHHMLELVRANEEAAFDMERKAADRTLEVRSLFDALPSSFVCLFVCLFVCFSRHSFDCSSTRNHHMPMLLPMQQTRLAELKERMLERVEDELEELRAAFEEAGAC
jgi:hypothetical protein